MSLTGIVKSRAWQIFWHFLFRSFIMIGLPLLGWGLDDLAGFFASPVRAAFVLVALVQTLINAWVLYGKPLPPEPDEPFEPLHAHYDVIESIFFLVAFSTRRDVLTWNAGLLLGWLGLAIYTTGSGLSLWANVNWVNYLRRPDVRNPVRPALLRVGPFRWIRYPGLLCLGLYSLGFSLMFQSWLGLAFMIPLIAIFRRRIKTLEAENAAAYPKDWPARCQTSKRIIPLVY
jgi:protein-S-isoprenylcysteine O-methyltransferase Ste14